jgi:uncharacterized repeat protein (TIGR01451 family)
MSQSIKSGVNLMKSLTITLALLAVLLIMGTDSVWSQEKGGVDLNTIAEMEIEVINDVGEKEIKRVAAEKVVPGDVVIYTVSYSNNGEEPAENFVITNPVPDHMAYVPESASGDNTNIQFSVDGGKSYDIPANLAKTDSDGNEVAAGASDYTHIRWTLNDPVAPGVTGNVIFKAILK